MQAITTRFLMSYPAMSAYEFDHFMREPEVRAFWQSSSIYMICQRPVIYFSDVVPDHSQISGEIKQRGSDKLLRFRMPILSGRPGPYFGETSPVMCEMQFYESNPRREPPFTNVAGFKFFDESREFLGWLSPERFIYEYLTGRVSAEVHGEIHDLLRYRVHYVGKAQDQPIWKRLSRHESFQHVLSREFPFIGGEVPALEVALLFFGLDAATVTAELIADDSGGIVDSAGHLLTDDDIGRVVTTDYASTLREQITTDAEAYLINFMLPKYPRWPLQIPPLMATSNSPSGEDRNVWIVTRDRVFLQ